MTDLVTIHDYKGYRGISSSTDDARLDIIIPSVSDMVKNYCGRSFIDFYSENKVEVFSLPTAQNVVFLSEIPTVSIVSVEELTYNEGSSYTTLTSSQYKLDTYLDAVYRIEADVRTDFPIGVNAVKVTYKGGFSATPADLKIAILDLITYYVKEEWRPELNVGQFMIRNSDAKPNFPDHIRRVLDSYREQ